MRGGRAVDALKTLALTALALTAFAGNSILCRLALGRHAIDPASFTLVRLASGAITLWLVIVIRTGVIRTGVIRTGVIRTGVIRNRRAAVTHGTWFSAGLLFVYAATFSFAYLTLSAGTGALILFAGVQMTMMAAGLRAGERLHPLGWAGTALAVGGLCYLVSPGVSAPSPAGAALMATAGIAWGLYSLQGRRASEAMSTTMGNFVRATPFALGGSLIAFAQFHLSPAGAAMALLSGSVTSGIGYVFWYSALPALGATRGATVQLAVPLLATAGGVLFLSEALSMRLSVAAVVILGGIGMVFWRPAQPKAGREGGQTRAAGDGTAGAR
jgi:drug/metabolite transporter (DMT)-like permease